ncbi:sensor histidine kinase [Breznakibacter xylanolyticus]|nr:sensor histidine kinase [Breznakibacter xylanolyticus]
MKGKGMNREMKRFYRLVGIVLFVLLGQFNGQSAKFYNINSLYGISLREVNSVCSDEQGFIWASSKIGILRITDDDHRIYQLPYANTNVITVKLVYEQSHLYAFSNNGQIFQFNPIYDRFDLMLDLSVMLNTRYLNVLRMFVDASGTFWFASTMGVYRYQSGQLTLGFDIRNENFAITPFDDHQFVLVQNNAVLLLDTQSSKVTTLYAITGDVPMQPSSVYHDRVHQRLWIGTISSGLYLFDFKTQDLRRVLDAVFPRQPILDIEKNSESTMLIGVDGQGIWEVDSQATRVMNVLREQVNDPSSLKGNGVYDLYCDNHRRVWVCTFSGGLSFFDQATPLVTQVSHQINNPNSLANNDVNNIIEDRNGKLWFATNNGVSCWNVSTHQWQHLMNDTRGQAKVFMSLCEDDQGRIWAGSYSSGVYVFDSKSGRELAHYMRNEAGSPVLSDFVLDIYKDHEGDIWIGGVNGEFICYQQQSGQFRTYTREPINVFAEIAPGELLLGCSYGLIQLNKHTGAMKQLLLGFSVTDILVQGDVVWLCTGGEGVIQYHPAKAQSNKIDVRSGLPSNFVKSIVDVDDYLWIGTESGLCRLNPSDLSVVSYSSNYLLSRSSFNNRSHCQLRNGQLAWGTNLGALLFQPSQVQEMPSGGKIFLQDLLVSGRSVRDTLVFDLTKPIDQLESVELKYYQNTFSLEMLSIQTSAGSKFSWQLEGFDKEWSQPSDNRMVTYTNIPSGSYVLKVRMYDSSLSHVVDERTLSIEIVPPFWKAWWFWVLVYVVLLGLAVLVFIYYLKSIRQKHTEEKVRFFTNTAHDIRTSLTLINAPVEALNREPHLTKEGRHYLGLAIEQARRLSSVVTQLMDFQKVDIGKEQLTFVMVDVVGLVSRRISMFDSLAQSRHIQLVFTPSQSQFLTGIDESKMERVVDNLLSNAIKYSREHSKVEISLTTTEQTWVLVVTDQGIGMSKAIQRRLFKEFFRGENAINSKIVGSGIGLLLVKNYVTMHQGAVSCVSRENEGSAFRVEIPYRQVAQMSLPDDHVSKSLLTDKK